MQMAIKQPLSRRALSVFVLPFVLWVGCGETSEQNGGDDPEETTGADITVVSAQVEPDQVVVGERTTITALLVNEGDEPGQATVSVEIDEETYLSQEHFVPPPNEADEEANQSVVDMRWRPEEVGQYEVSVNGVTAGTVVVDPPDVDIQIHSTGITPDVGEEEVAVVGESFTVDVQLQNFGDANGEIDLEFEVDQQVVAEKSVLVPTAGPGGDPMQTQTRAEFVWSPESAGNFELTVNSVEVATVQASSPPQVSIVEPTNAPEEFFVVEAKEDGQGWYVEIDFVASAQDETDGELEGESLQWTTTADENDDGTVTTRTLGEGAEITQRLFMADENCGALTEHVVEVEAVNSAGLAASKTHRVILQMGAC